MTTYHLTPWVLFRTVNGLNVYQARIIHTASKLTIDYALRVEGSQRITTKTETPIEAYGL
jgi:hypothetical protein